MSLRAMFSVLVLGASLIVSTLPATAQAPSPVRILVLPLETDATAYYAADLGLFAKYGLNVELQVGSTGAATAAAITGGAAEVGYGNLITVAQAVESGIPFAVLMPCSAFSSSVRPQSVLIVAKNSPIHTAKDLTGKSIGVNGIGSLQQLGPMAWLDKNGGDSKAIHWLDLSPVEEPAALAQGRVDAISATEPMVSIALSQGGRVLANYFVAIAPEFVTGGWFVSRPWAQAHADVAAKLQHALSEAAIWANAHPKESAALFAKHSKLAPETIARMARARFAEKADPLKMRPTLAAAAKYGLLKAPIDAATLLLTPAVNGN